MTKIYQLKKMIAAMWDLREISGVMDSERKDCKYVDYKGHMLDKEMLDIMKRGL